MKQILSRSIVAFVLLVVGGVFAFGQVTTTGSINGAVTDPAGAVVGGATVTSKNDATNFERTATTSDDGTFTIPSVAPGTFTVTITAQGFKTTVLKGVVVNAGTPSSVKAQLEIGQIGEQVTITGAGGELLQTQSATVGQTITGQQITDLPQASRNALDLILLLPGTNTPGRPRQSTVNGLPKEALNITMDGVNIQDNLLKGSDGFFTFVQPRVDAIEEVSISTSTPGAESSGEGAVQIKFVTKGGTSEFHGGLFEYHRNPSLNANFYYNNRDLAPNPNKNPSKAPRTRQLLNQFGGKIGGPVLFPFINYNRNRDKLFFFVDYEEYRLPEQQLRTRNIIAPAAQGGTFTYNATVTASTVIPSQCTRTSNTTATCSLNVLSYANGRNAAFTGTADPTIAGLFSAIRATTVKGTVVNTGDPNVQQFSFTNPGGQRRRFPTGRADWNITKNQHIETIYNYQQFKSTVDFLNNADPAFPGFPNFGSQDSNRFSFVTALRSTISSRIVNEARYGLTGGTVLFFPQLSPGQFTNQGGFALAIANAGASLGLQNATVVNSPQRRNSPVKQFSDTLTYVRGQHNMSFGGNFSQINAFLVSAPGGAVSTVSFAQDITDPVNAIFQPSQLPLAPAATIATQAEELYRVLTGRINNISGTAALNEAGNSYTFNQNFIERYRQREMGAFAQDSWRIRPNLTLTYGVRYDLQYAPISLNSSLTQNTFQGLFGRAGTSLESTLFHPFATGGTPTQFTPLPAGQHFYTTDKNNFLPSVGFAYQPDFKSGFLKRLQGNPGQTVIRGGYSIADLRNGLNLSSSIVGSNFGGTVDAARLTGRNFVAGSALLRNPASIPAPVFAATPVYPLQPEGIGATAAGPNASANSFLPNLKTPYVISFTGGIQREITKDMVIEARYVGNRGHQIFRQVNLNEINTVENGIFNEFLRAQANLAANRAAGNGNTFAFTGAPGTSPLPITLAFFQSIPVGDARSQAAANYTSSFFTNGSFLTTLSPVSPNALTYANLFNNPANGLIQRATAAGLPANFIVLNPQIRGGSFLVNNDGKTWYDALTIEVRRRMSAGLLLQGSYTFGKAENDFYASSSIASSQPRTLRNTNLDKTHSPFDIHNGFKLNYIYELPFGNGKRFWSGHNGVVNGLVGGWTVNGTTRLQSGAALLLGNVQLVGLTVKDLQHAVEIRKLPNRQIFWLPDDIAQNTIKAFNFNSAGFTQGAPTGRYISPANSNGCVQRFGGDCGFANLVIHGPRFLRQDMSIVKKIRITEKSNLELRGEALNIINNINFKLGDYATDAASVGQTVGGQIAVPTFSSSLFGQLNGNGNAYRDTSTTNDPGGRLVQLVVRFNF